MFLESPEDFLTFVFGAQNACFFEVPMNFLTFVVGDICFGAQHSCYFFPKSPAGFLTKIHIYID